MKKKPGFSKGNTPWNKNLKGIHLSEKSEFKSGQRGSCWVPIGTIKVSNIRGTIRNKVKVDEKRWELNSAYLWRLKYGKIIKGDVIHHLDGISLHDVIENLIALPRKDHPIFHNKWWLKKLTEEQIKYYLSRYE